MKVIPKSFYKQNTLTVAKQLLGKVLCRRVGERILRGIIVETEAYTQDEPSCHAYRGVTNRSKTLFEEGGIAYVYFIYGMYHCMNVVTDKKGYGSAVLIRALEPLENLDNTNGPAKLCKELEITRELNETDLTTSKSGLWIEFGDDIREENIITTERIGIKSATDYPWRFYIKHNKCVSKK